MDAAPKAVLPVRPRFRPEDYIAGNVPSIDSEEYKKILQEEEEERQKAAAEKLERERQRETSFVSKNFEIAAKFSTTGSRTQRTRLIKRKSTEDSDPGPSRQLKSKRRKKIVVKDVSVKTADPDWDNASVGDNFDCPESDEELEWSDDVDGDLLAYSEVGSIDDSEVDIDDDLDDEDNDELTYFADERLLDYIVRTHEEADGAILEETEIDPENPASETENADFEDDSPLVDETFDSQEKDFIPECSTLQTFDDLTNIPPKDHSFDLKTLKNGDIILVDKTGIDDGYKKATVLIAFHGYNHRHQFFQGHRVMLNNRAKKRMLQRPNNTMSVFLVHYLQSDRRLDEWIDGHEIHCLLERAIEAPPTNDDDCLKKKIEDDAKLRSKRKLGLEFTDDNSNETVGATYAQCEEKLEEVTMVRNIDTIEIGTNVIRCWYFSPFPPEIVVERKLFMCEYCLMYCCYQDFYSIHRETCEFKEPPGPIIYTGENFIVHEVNGNDNYRYCQSLCLLSKLFLDHKTVFYAISTFYFYVLMEFDDEGNKHLVGFFSKENFSMNNLACIMVLPPYQRKGYGKLLIQLSYTLSARENFIGSPEKPLSDLGKISYKSLWWFVLVNTLDAMQVEEDIPVSELSNMTGIHEDDIILTFEPYQLIKRWKDGVYVVMNEHVLAFCKSLSFFSAPKLFLDVDCITWTERYQSEDPEDDEDSDASGAEDDDENLTEYEKRKRNYERTREKEAFLAAQDFGSKWLAENKHLLGHIGLLNESDSEEEEIEGDYIPY